MSPGSAYTLMHHWIGEIEGHFGAWGWVKGGMGGVTHAMRRSAENAGVEVRTGQHVAKVAINSESRAVGVELDDGSVVRSTRVSPTSTHAPPISTWSVANNYPTMWCATSRATVPAVAA